ncbi:hypothetical protein CJI58_001705 [Bifidobacteriaceae bacterium NR047]|nr:hypothetical protein [Bifidobacteriaceae bacterium NR047]
MLNKKAIAAFAAGATLLSGLAFAAPALAEAAKDASKTEQKADPKHEAAVKAAQDKVDATKKSLNDAKDDEKKAQKAFDKENHKLDGLNDAVDSAQDALTAVQKEQSDYEAAQKVIKDAEAKLTTALKNLKKYASEDTKAKCDADNFNDAKPAKDKDIDFNAAKGKVLAAKSEVDKAKQKAKDDKHDTDKSDAVDQAQDKLDGAKQAVTDAQKADTAYDKAKKELEAAKAKVEMYTTLLASYEADLAKLKGETPVKPTPVTPADVKAVVEFSLKYIKDAKSDAKTVATVKAALAKLQAAKDKAAKAAAFKELKALVEPLMKKVPPTPEDNAPALKSIFGSDVLYTNYKGLAAELVKRGITNIGAYDALLDTLQYGLRNGGWDNVVKNFPEHGPKNNCDFLAGLRRHLTKAVKHYGHVVAAVKDMVVELNEDKKDALAAEDYVAAKVIKEKLALANGLLTVAKNNLSRANALLDSANDHARDLSCDTGAKDVRKAMDKEPNSPFKKSGQKNDAKKPEAQKPNGSADGSHQLGKTGATVALVAVAASVLAGMGAALRKIRH